MRGTIRNKGAGFVSGNSGAVFVFVGLMLFLIVPLVGGVLDIGRAAYVKSRYIAALESAAFAGSLYALRHMEADGSVDIEGETAEEIERFFSANFPAYVMGAEVKPLSVRLQDRKLRVGGCVYVTPYFLQLIGMEHLEVCHGV